MSCLFIDFFVVVAIYKLIKFYTYDLYAQIHLPTFCSS